MTAFIALKSINEHLTLRHSPFNSLKQEALLFDKIGILNLGYILDMCLMFDYTRRMADSINLSPEQRMEIGWLMENGVVFDAKLSRDPDDKIDTEEYRSLSDSYSVAFGKRIKAFVRSAKAMTDEEKLAEAKRYILDSLTHEAIALRLAALQLEKDGSAKVSPLLSYSKFGSEVPTTQITEVLHVVIENLPLPNDNTPWEQIVDFRTDPENQKNLQGLRRWIRKISSEKLTRSEIEDELRWLINEFERYMNVHKMEAHTETIETCVTAPLEILEDIVTLRFSNIPKPFFAIRKRNLALLKAELNAPGKELAYLVKAKENFYLE